MSQPQATHLIVKDKEAEATALWGSMILLGYLISTLLEIVIDCCRTEQLVVGAVSTLSLFQKEGVLSMQLLRHIIEKQKVIAA